MGDLKMRHLLAIPAIVITVMTCANRCTKPVPAQNLYQNEASQQRLIREKQNAADFVILQAEKAHERINDKEQMKGVVYEN